MITETMQSGEFFTKKLTRIDSDIAILKKSRKDLIKLAEEKGFFLKDNAFVEDTFVTGVIEKWAYYSRYVGEKGALYDYDECAYVSNHDLEKLKEEFLFLRNSFDKKIVITFPQYFSFFSNFRDQIGEHIEFPTEDDLSGKYWPWKEMKEPERSRDLRKMCEKYFVMFSYDNDNSKLSFRYIGESDQGEYVNGSGFDIGKYRSVSIEKHKNTSFEDKFDRFSDNVEW